MSKEKPFFRLRRGNYSYDYANWGHLSYIAGPPGTQKTTQLSYLTAAALKGEPVLGYDIDLQGRNVVIIDGEQPQDLYVRGRHRIEQLCDGKNLHRLYYPEQTLAAIPNVRDRQHELWRILTEVRHDVGILVIDRLGNFVSDVNNSRECEKLLSKLATYTEYTKCLPIAVSHMTLDRWGTPIKLFGMLGTMMNQLFSEGLMTVKSSKYFGVLDHKVRYKNFPDLWVHSDEDTGFLSPLPYCPFRLK